MGMVTFYVIRYCNILPLLLLLPLPLYQVFLQLSSPSDIAVAY